MDIAFILKSKSSMQYPLGTKQCYNSNFCFGSWWYYTVECYITQLLNIKRKQQEEHQIVEETWRSFTKEALEEGEEKRSFKALERRWNTTLGALHGITRKLRGYRVPLPRQWVPSSLV